MFKNFAMFTACIIQINNTQVDNAKDLDVVMFMYKLFMYKLFRNSRKFTAIP